MGHSHEHRPYISRRQFLKRAGIVGGAISTGPHFWRPLVLAADAPPSQLHLAFGRDAATEMSVSWMTPAAVDAPFVELAGHRFTARTVQYEGYPGFFHHVDVTGLSLASAYAYEVGHAGTRQGVGSTFRTGPGAGAPFTFTAFGDQGTDGAFGQPPMQPSVNTDLAQRLDPAFHMIVGDLAYANGNQAIWDDWFTMVSPMAKTTPWMPLPGNHEIESQLDVTGTGDSWGAFGYDPYRTRFSLPSNGHADLQNCYYAFRYGSVRYICIDNNDVNDEVTHNIGYTNGRQAQFVEAELAAARLDPNVDFIIVGMHQCAFSSSSKHGSDPGVQRAWFDLFRRFSVDLVLQGHDHVYERTHAMAADEIVSEGPVYDADVGTVYVTCGNGGAVQEPFNPVQPGWSAFRQELKVGTLQIEVQPNAAAGRSRLMLSEHWALDGSIIEDGIVLERTAAAPAPAPESKTVGGSPARASTPSGTLPATGGPAGTALVGIAAAAGGLALRAVTREERRQERADS